MYRVAIVGPGKMGAEWASVIEMHPKLEAVATVGRTLESAEIFNKKWGIPLAFDNPLQAYERTQPDAVIVAVPPSETSRVLALVVTKPWKCLVEKPAGRNLSESALLRERHTHSRRPISVALNRRYYPHIQQIRSDLAGRNDALFIQARDQYTINMFDGKTMDTLFAKAIHVVDLFHFFSDGVVESCSSSFLQLGDDSFVVEASIDFSCRTRIQYASVINAPGRWEMSLHLGDLNWKLDPLEKGWILEDFPGEKREIRETKGIEFGKPGLSAILDGLVEEIERDSQMLPTLADSHASMTLLANIFSVVDAR